MKYAAILGILLVSSCEGSRFPVGYDKAMKEQQDHPITQTLTLPVIPSPAAPDATEGPGPLDTATAILNFGKDVWSIVDAGKPVADIKADFASAMPVDTLPAPQDFEPIKRLTTMKLGADNGYGYRVVDVDLSVVSTSNGVYIAAASIVPSNVMVNWGWGLDLKVTKVSVQNRHGYAAITFVLVSTIWTAVQKSTKTFVIDVDAANKVVIL